MGEVDNVSAFQVDPSALKQSWEKMASHDPVGLTPFSKALNTAANFATLFGPTVDVALSGSPKAAGIFNGVLSGFMNSGVGGGTPYASWSTPGMTPGVGGSGYGFKGLGGGGMPSVAPGYPGGGGGGFSAGGGIGASGGFGGAGAGMPGAPGTDFANLDSQANSLLNHNMLFLSLQTKLQNVNMVVQA
ncbi:MAG: hypothetical protein ACREP8_10425, partial [Candidatus Binatia bacterium]